jgi:hypothetical protein
MLTSKRARQRRAQVKAQMTKRTIERSTDVQGYQAVLQTCDLVERTDPETGGAAREAFLRAIANRKEAAPLLTRYQMAPGDHERTDEDAWALARLGLAYRRLARAERPRFTRNFNLLIMMFGAICQDLDPDAFALMLSFMRIPVDPIRGPDAIARRYYAGRNQAGETIYDLDLAVHDLAQISTAAAKVEKQFAAKKRAQLPAALRAKLN